MMSQIVTEFIQIICVCTVIKTIAEIVIPENKNFELVNVAVNLVVTFEIIQKLISIIKYALG